MKILCIDTASDICGVSILEDTNLLINLDNNTGRTHSENLMPMIKEAFDKTYLSLIDVELIVCDKGPGSFTGIRIGIACAKAFNDSLNIPCIGVSSLEALAYNILQSENSDNFDNLKNAKLVCSILDCKNNNCYFALYERKENYFETLIEPQAENINATIAILKNYIEDNFGDSSIVFVGDGSKVFQTQIKENFKNAQIAKENLNILNSYNLGVCGFKKFMDCSYIEEELLPLYLKKPQAQRQLEEKMENGTIPISRKD